MLGLDRALAARVSLALASVVVGCGSPARTAGPPLRSGAAPGAASAATPNGGLPPPAPDRVVLAPTKRVALEASLSSIRGSAKVLAFVDHAGAPALIAQVVGEDGPSGKPFAIAGVHLVRAFESDAGAITVVAARGRELCFYELGESGPKALRCVGAAGHALTQLGQRFLLLDVRPPEEEEDGSPREAKRAPSKGASTPKAKPAPKKKASPKPKGRTKQKGKGKGHGGQKEALKKLMSSGKKVELWATWLDDGGPSEAVFTGLDFKEAMTGVGFVAAEARKQRVDVVFYEHADPRGADAYGKIGIAGLDAEAAFDPASRKSFGESKLEPGFLTDHADLRLVSSAEGSVLLGLRGPRGKCDVTVAGPFVMQMIPVAEDCALDPMRFLTLARAKHQGVEPSLEPQTTLPAERARRAFGQAGWDVGRSVLSRDRAWTFSEDELFYFRGTPQPVKVSRPLEVERSTVRWGSFATDGSGLVETDAGLIEVGADGAVHPVAGPDARFITGPSRRDLNDAGRSDAAKIGDTWWQARGELRRLHPAASDPLRPLPYDAAVVVGGPTSGLVIEASAATMTLHSLSKEGELAPLGSYPTALGAGLDAAPRAGGGAIVAGPTGRDGKRIVALAIDSKGRVSAERDIPLFPAADARELSFVRLVALPHGGALLYDPQRSRVAWLDDDGAFVTSASLEAATKTAPALPCLDGRAAPTAIASEQPGRIDPLAAPGTCIVSEIVRAADGTIRWAGIATDGVGARAELGLVRSTGAAAAPAAGKAEIAAPVSRQDRGRRCPSDMVLVGSDLCVDRYEGTLADLGTGRFLSTDYASTPANMLFALGEWATKRERQGDLYARAFPLPEISKWQRTASLTPVALSRASSRPSGYVTGTVARASCEAAGKRLCTRDEWKHACRGAADRMFPYGDAYEEGACNVNGSVHPGVVLHDNAAVGHLDPRLDRVETDRGPLLALTGQRPRCASRWGDDAVYDMVGNLDEWVDEKGGAFAGGFYARGTTAGCEAIVTAHPFGYLDYSTGVRCCKDAGR